MSAKGGLRVGRSLLQSVPISAVYDRNGHAASG